MRNKILVLVLALVCLLSVSALAAGEKVYANLKAGGYTAAQLDKVRDDQLLESEHELYKTVEDSASFDFWGDNYKFAVEPGYAVEPSCETQQTITVYCNVDLCDLCDADDIDYTTRGGVNLHKITVNLPKLEHITEWDYSTDENNSGDEVIDFAGRNGSKVLDHVSPTCKEAGWVVVQCAKCDYTITYQGKTQLKADGTADPTYTDILKKLSHVDTESATGFIETVENKGNEASCTEYATKKWTCSECGEVVKTEVDYVSGMLPHDFTKKITEWVTYNTCAQAGQKKTTVRCVVCNATKPGAVVEYETVTKESHAAELAEFANLYTLTGKTNKNGLKYATINAAEANIEMAYKADEQEFKGTFHIKEDDGTRIIKKGTLTFVYEPMTCDKDGLITISCNVCDTHDVQYAVATKGHQPMHNGEMPEMEDCTKSYKVGFVCWACNGTYTEILSAFPYHNYQEEPGLIIQYWNNGATKVEWYRNWTEWNEDANGNWISTEYENVILINGKIAGDAKLADCLPYTEVYQCENGIEGFYGCQATKTVEVKATAKKHSAVPTTDDGNISEKDCISCVQPTCTSTGTANYACAFCGDTVSATVEALKHVAKAWTEATPATCEAPGKAVAVCKNCSTPMEETLPQLVHKMELRPELSKPANVCTAGEEVYTCDNCDKIEYKSIPAQHLEPDYIDDIEDYIDHKTASCKTAGYKKFICKQCGQVVTVEIPKLAHEFETVLDDDIFEARFVEATCCSPAYYYVQCNKGCGTKKPVFVGEAEGHNDLTKQELADIRDDVYNNTFDKTEIVVNGVIDCYNAATGYKLCKETYDVWTETNGEWKLELDKGVCTHKWEFTLPVREHIWSAPMIDSVTGEYYVECEWADCEAVKATDEIKPEYEISFEGAKGKVVLKNKNMAALNQAWVRISYGFELSDGSNFAIITCMPITFEYDESTGEQIGGTFSFFDLNSSLKYTGVNCMVVDQYDAMSKPIGELVGSNYGMYIE